MFCAAELFVSFVETRERWELVQSRHGMRRQIQENILWSYRDTTYPSTTIVDSEIVHSWHKCPHGRAVWVEKELHDFLHGEGQMPF